MTKGIKWMGPIKSVKEWLDYNVWENVIVYLETDKIAFEHVKEGSYKNDN